MENIYKIGKDLREILIKTIDGAKEKKQKYVTTDNIIYQIYKRYIVEKSGTCGPLTKYFNGFTDSDKNEFSKRVEAYNNLGESGKTILPEKYNPDTKTTGIAFSRNLNDIARKAFQSLTTLFIFKIDYLETDLLFYTIICSDGYETLLEGLSKNTNPVKLKSYISESNLENGFNKAISGIGDNGTPATPWGTPAKMPDGPISLDDFFSSLSQSEEFDKYNTKDKMDKDDKDFEKYGDADNDINVQKADPNSKTPFLDLYSVDMTKNARLGKYDPVFGRDKEIDQIIEIICHRKKNNAILVGDPGVGKSSVVEYLSQRIAEGKVPEKLKNKRICSLDLNAIVAGTKYRGQYEERLQGIIKEVISNPNIIVFIDEFHNLVGNGNSSGSGDGANILKPYLARGEFQCIGSTTQEEYRKYVEKDGALKRRFLNVQINEPTVEQTYEILKTAAPIYEKNHKVKFDKDIIKACVDWSGRYITDRFFPDKAIDILDAAGTLRMLKTKKSDTGEEKLENEIEDLKKKKQAAVRKQDFELAGSLKKQQNDKETELNNLRKSIEKKENQKSNWPNVEMEDVATAISEVSKIPVDKIIQTDNEMISKMKTNLEKSVIGQQETINLVVRCLQRNFLGLRDETKPIASLLFCGSTGTGKSLMAKMVAESFFGSQRNLVKFDMSQLTSEADVSRLLGSAPGYIGYDDEAGFNKIRNTNGGNVVCLFDEIEKANPKIFDIFLNILDEGDCTLSDGTKIDFTNSIIIFTSNIGTKEIKDFGNGLGFNKITNSDEKNKQNASTVKKAVERTFRPEFINRLTSVVTFNDLGTSELDKIFNIELSKKKAQLKKNGYTIKVSPAVKKHVVEKCDTSFGARDLSRNIETEIMDNLGDKMLEEPLAKNFSIDYKDDKIVVTSDKDKKESVKVDVKKDTETPKETKEK